MDPEAVNLACDQAAAQIVWLIGVGVIPVNAWVFIRPLEVWGEPTRVMIWTLIVSPN